MPMLEHDRQIIHSSEDPNWRTPPACFQALHAEFNFSLDLAASRNDNLCSLWFGPDHVSTSCQDSLKVEWASQPGRTGFLNPPYSKKLKMPIGPWLEKCWNESQAGATIVAILPFAPQTEHYRRFVYGIGTDGIWLGHAAREERRLPHRISFLRPDGSSAGNAGVNSVIVVWKPKFGTVGPWTPHSTYWSYR